MSTLLEKLKKSFESKEGKEALQKWAEKFDKEDAEKKRFFEEDLDRELIHLKSEMYRLDEDIALNNSLDEEEHTKLGFDVEMIYKVIDCVFSFCDETVHDPNDYGCPPETETIIYGGLDFYMIHGQGTFTRITHNK